MGTAELARVHVQALSGGWGLAVGEFAIWVASGLPTRCHLCEVAQELDILIPVDCLTGFYRETGCSRHYLTSSHCCP